MHFSCACYCLIIQFALYYLSVVSSLALSVLAMVLILASCNRYGSLMFPEDRDVNCTHMHTQTHLLAGLTDKVKGKFRLIKRCSGYRHRRV